MGVGMFLSYLMRIFVSYASIIQEAMQNMVKAPKMLLESPNQLGEELPELKLEIYWTISRLIFSALLVHS
jgi:hypothetical protein